MNLLLLLSALLSAFGGTSGARAAQVPTAALSTTVARVAEAVTATRIRRAASRPAVTLPTPAQDAGQTVVVFALPASIPAFASRRRE